MGKQPRWYERCIGLAAAALCVGCGSTLSAGLAAGYLAWVEPVPLRFAPARTPGPPSPLLFEQSPATESLPKPVASDPVSDPGPLPTPEKIPPAEDPEPPAAPPETLVSGPEAMIIAPIPAGPQLLLVSPQTLVELMRMHGTNATLAMPPLQDSPIFIPPAPPASRATYSSAPASKP